MADSLRDGAIFELTKKGSACLCARLFPLRQAAKNCVHSHFFFFPFRVVCLGGREAKRDFQLLLHGDVGCFFLLCQRSGWLRGD